MKWNEIKNIIIKQLNGYTREEYNKKINQISELETKFTETAMQNYDYIDRIGAQHLTLDAFKAHLSRLLKKVDIRYNFDGISRKQVWKSLKTDSDEAVLYYNFVKELLGGFNTSNADDLIYVLNNKLNSFIARKYNTEKQAWNKNHEYWGNATELYVKYVEQRSAGDCDDTALFKFHCIKQGLVLNNLWEENKWRLRCLVVNIIGAERHFLLAWVKEGKLNDWIAVESTYMPESFLNIWNDNKSISGNWLYDIDYSFDEETAYRKL